MFASVLVGVAAFLAPAHAGKCDALVKQADRLSGTELADVFRQVVACDATEAEAAYVRFMTRATDDEALVALSLAAIDGQVWNPVWIMPGKISDYAVRDVIASQVGEVCGEHPRVVGFLEGAYFGLRGLDFQQWDDAFITCRSAELDDWMDQQIASPPASSYDEKYDLLMGIYVARRGREALPGLKDAAVAAAARGPFDAILLKMDEAVAPPLGRQMNAEDQAALQGALVALAQQVSPARARSVADRLVAAGAEDAAAQLLPAVFPDRQDGGAFTWGGIGVERADCKGVKTAVLHAASIHEPGRRWIVTDEVFPALRGAKAVLKKCLPEEGDWPVITSPEPLVPGSFDAWVRTEAGKWMSQGYEVQIQNEKLIVLQ